jgi:pilus assembly protein Flp/PilA
MYNTMLSAFARFQTRMATEDGATMVEYGLLVALIGILLIGAIGVLRGGLQGMFNAAGAAVSGATP